MLRILAVGLAPFALALAGTPPVHSLAIAAGDASLVYAGTTCAGVFKSADGGLTWQAANGGLTNPQVDALAIDPAAPLTILAGAGGRVPKQFGYVYTIFRSADGGGNWVETRGKDRGPLNSGYAGALVFDRSNPGMVHAILGSTYFQSADHGVTWTTPSTVRIIRALALDPFNPTTLFLVASGEYFSNWDVFRGWPGGKWRELYSDLPGSPGVLIADPVTPSTLYALDGWWVPGHSSRLGPSPTVPEPMDGGIVVEGKRLGRLFKSVDGGVNWSILKSGLPADGISDLAIDPANPAILYAASPQGVFKSTDAGLSWATANNGLLDVRGVAIAVDPAHPETLFLGTDYGIFKSIDGALSWKPINQGLPDCADSR